MNIHQKARRKCTCMLLSERRQSEKPTYYDSNYMTLWTRKTYRKSEEKDEWLPEVGWERDERGAQRTFRAVKLLSTVYNGGDMSFHICPNSQNVHHQE